MQSGAAFLSRKFGPPIDYMAESAASPYQPPTINSNLVEEVVVTAFNRARQIRDTLAGLRIGQTLNNLAARSADTALFNAQVNVATARAAVATAQRVDNRYQVSATANASLQAVDRFVSAPVGNFRVPLMAEFARFGGDPRAIAVASVQRPEYFTTSRPLTRGDVIGTATDVAPFLGAGLKSLGIGVKVATVETSLAPKLLAAEAAATGGLRTSAVVSPARAEAFLVKRGFSLEDAKSYVGSFDGPITARIVRPGENFVRYTGNPKSTGDFLTQTRFSDPASAVEGLYLGPYGNPATLIQPVTSKGRSIVLEGAIKNGGTGIGQTVINNRDAFTFGLGQGF